jgi:hypothetical protein
MVSWTGPGEVTLCSKHHREPTKERYPGIEPSLEESGVDVVDANGRIVRDAES